MIILSLSKSLIFSNLVSSLSSHRPLERGDDKIEDPKNEVENSHWTSHQFLSFSFLGSAFFNLLLCQDSPFVCVCNLLFSFAFIFSYS